MAEYWLKDSGKGKCDADSALTGFLVFLLSTPRFSGRPGNKPCTVGKKGENVHMKQRFPQRVLSWQVHVCGSHEAFVERVGTRARNPGADPDGHYCASECRRSLSPQVSTLSSKQRGSLTMRGCSLFLLKLSFTLLDNPNTSLPWRCRW